MTLSRTIVFATFSLSVFFRLQIGMRGHPLAPNAQRWAMVAHLCQWTRRFSNKQMLLVIGIKFARSNTRLKSSRKRHLIKMEIWKAFACWNLRSGSISHLAYANEHMPTAACPLGSGESEC